MKIKLLSDRNEISENGHDVDILHLAFRPSDKDIMKILKECEGVKALHVPKSYAASVSKSGIMAMEMKGVKFLVGDVWGQRKDINQYYELNGRIMDEINVGVAREESVEKIVNKVEFLTNVSSDLIRWAIVEEMGEPSQ